MGDPLTVVDSSPCDSCREPGACCRGFTLSVNFRPEDGRAEVVRRMGQLGLPFEPIGRALWQGDPAKPWGVRWRFSCPELGADGRCMIYGDRPKLCRDFEPKSSALCVEFEGPWKTRQIDPPGTGLVEGDTGG